MAMPTVIWVGLVAAKMAVAFVFGKKYGVSRMKEAARKEMAGQNIPDNYVQKIIDGIEARVQQEEMTFDDFIELFLEVADEVTSSAEEKLSNILDSLGETTASARESIANFLRKAAEMVSGGESK